MSFHKILELCFSPSANCSKQSLSAFSFATAARLLVLSASLAGISVLPAADLINGLGGTAGFGENNLPVNDDESLFINLSTTFPNGIKFAGVVYTGVYLNNNGNLTFGSSLLDYTPTAISANTSRPILAAWFADVDTRGSGMTASAGGNSTGSNRVWYDQDAASGTATFTWDDVGYYNRETSKKNAFQIRLIRQGTVDFNLEFRYENLEWTTGDASDGINGLGGTVARAGWSCGNGTNFYELAEAGDQDLMLALTTPGVITWSVSDPVVTVDSSALTLINGSLYTKNATLSVPITFDQPITGFALSDLVMTNGGTPIALSGSGTSWIATLQMTSEGPYTLTLPAGAVQSQFLGSSQAVSLNFIVDRTPPAVSAGTALAIHTATALSGSASDALSGLATTTWSQVSGPGTLSFIDATSPTTQVSATMQGRYTLKLIGRDRVGNQAQATTTVVWDVTPPTVTASTATVVPVNVTTTPQVLVSYADATSGLGALTLTPAQVVITSTGSVSGSSVAVTGSGATRTIALSGSTGDGTVSISVAAGTVADLAGNNAGGSNTITFQIDNTPPAAPVFTNPVSYSAVASLPVTGTAEAGALVTLRNGTTVLGSGLADSSGNWAITVLLVEGPNSITARATDVAGNSGVDSVAMDVGTPPYAPVILTHAGSTNSTTPTITGTTHPFSVIELLEWTTVLGSVTADSSGNWSITASELADGGHVLKARATDTHGASSPDSATLTMIVDTVRPIASLGIPSALLVSASSTITVAVTYTDSDLQAITLDRSNVVVTGSNGASATVTAVSGTGTTRTVTLQAFTGTGALSIHIAADTAVDRAGNGNLSSAESAPITVDGDAPLVVSVSTAAHTPTTADPKIPVTVIFNSQVTTPKISPLFGKTASTPTSSDGGTTWNFTLTATTAGPVAFNMTANDVAGNPMTPYSGVTLTTFDNSGPTTTVTMAPGQTNPSVAFTVRFFVTFSAAIDPETFSVDDLLIDGTAGGTLVPVITSVSGLGITPNTRFAVAIHGMTSTGTVQLTVLANGVQTQSTLINQPGTNATQWTLLDDNSNTSSHNSDLSGGGGLCGAGGGIGLILSLAMLGLRRRD